MPRCFPARRAREEAPGSQCANEIEGWTRPIIYCDRGHESTDIRGYKDKDPEFDKYHFHCQDCRLSLQVKPDLLELLLEPFRKAGMEKVPLQVLILAQQRGMVKR